MPPRDFRPHETGDFFTNKNKTDEPKKLLPFDGNFNADYSVALGHDFLKPDYPHVLKQMLDPVLTLLIEREGGADVVRQRLELYQAQQEEAQRANEAATAEELAARAGILATDAAMAA